MSLDSNIFDVNKEIKKLKNQVDTNDIKKILKFCNDKIKINDNRLMKSKTAKLRRQIVNKKSENKIFRE